MTGGEPSLRWCRAAKESVRFYLFKFEKIASSTSSYLRYSSLEPGFLETAESCHASSHMHLSAEGGGISVKPKPLLIIYQAY